MALVRDEYWLKLFGRKEAGRSGRAQKLWRVVKSVEVGFKARNKLITRNIECSAKVERSRTDGCDGVVCVRSKGS